MNLWKTWKRKTMLSFISKQLAMIHSEVSEVLEAIRKDKGDEEVVIELVDIWLECLTSGPSLMRQATLRRS